MKLLKSLHFDQTARIHLYSKGETKYFTIGQIIYCNADGNYCILWMLDGEKYTITDHLLCVEAILHDHGFCQINKSCIINLQFVSSISHNTITTVTLNNGLKFSVARRRKHGLLEKLGEPENT